MRILVVEDECRTAAYLHKSLSENGFTVDVARQDGTRSGSLRQADYDLVVLDALIPADDGWSILSDLRRAGKQPPVLFIGTGDSPVRRSDSRAPGSSVGGYFGFTELLRRIRAAIGRETDHRPGALRIADMELDWVALRATRAGRPLDLTRKEFQLLSLLARNPGKVLSRAVIADQVWGMNFDSKTNVVDVHIRRLRAKLDDPFTKRLIHTVRGLGYVLEDRSTIAPEWPRSTSFERRFVSEPRRPAL